MLAAVVERRLQRRNQRHQPADRIVGAMWIGDVTLTASDDKRAAERAAPAGLDGVAERLDIARLAEDAVVKSLAAFGRPLQELDRAVDRDALFVAGDQKRNRAMLRPAAIGGEIVQRRRNKAGDAALHVDGATAVDLVVRQFAGKGRMMPSCLVSRRHDIGMPGEHQIWFCCRPARKGFRPAWCLARQRSRDDGKARLRQHALQITERPTLLRRNRAAANEIARNGDGIGSHRP